MAVAGRRPCSQGAHFSSHSGSVWSLIALQTSAMREARGTTAVFTTSQLPQHAKTERTKTKSP